jgi:hypothetical protein
MEPPAPSPEMVNASRRHLTEGYAAGVDRLLWDTEKRLIPDLEAIRAVIAAAGAGHAEALDVGASLVLLQAARLELDRLEYQTLEAAHGIGMQDEAIAAVLELPDAGAAQARHQALAARSALPYEEPEAPYVVSTPRSDLGERAARRASQAANRAAEAARRREQLSQAREHRRRGSHHADAERATAHADEARVLAGEAAERVALGLVRAAEALDRCAAGYADFAAASAAAEDGGVRFAHKADEYHRAAVRYRKLAAEYRGGSARTLPVSAAGAAREAARHCC